ncbi:MAG: RdgB/HAM1 family non-canonical purine NTP pyrophosphatase [Planctomycetes bacterium]|nr:RdgB/HAM1 family non-canonical purine NTP pyrophosphatase [Planctomycetota bacterium]MCH9725469.1 RdgB/HAM1 family non-canonical purine NTP pyrophosphatase [Planctomycetota bacterium]MCH9776566.1 RdgB/HAM1 family non-canonical purine NTP pyrophosphatase [Planctomycetota bacterium]MCH9792500.1 RdgB/HAM1 family non-canonical purine NTP pyrophosphatase [Planctomycetota bacterium]
MAQYPVIVLASRNQKKAGEISELLSPYHISVQSVTEFADAEEVVEDGNTFGENAAKKAVETALAISQWTIGEDSGLMIDALNGAPGIYSARFSGEDATDEQNNAKMIQELENVSLEKRTAAYFCNVALSNPRGEICLQVEASCRGRITESPRGQNGFGYDPYFEIVELHKTFGELAPIVKQHLSHRARAFERFIPPLVELFEQQT